MYRVIKSFTDLKDNNYAYYVGDTFPHNGVEVGAERIAELASTQNRRRIPLIEEVVEKPKRTRKKKSEE